METTTWFPRAPGNTGALQGSDDTGGYKWGGTYGTGANLTFSFPAGSGDYETPYGDKEPNGFRALSATETFAIRDALSQWGSIADITFTETGGGTGDLRFARTTKAEDEAAHAYYPGSEEGGDVWFAQGSWHNDTSSTVDKGSYSYLVIIHEIGHALGLKHPFETPKIDKDFDSFAYTIMSYSAAPGQDNYASFYPTTPMYYDVLAMQELYGRGVHNAGDTTYVYQAGQSYWETIDDTGGIDTIVHQGRAKAVINLNVGQWSELGNAIDFSVGSTRKTVMIGPGTVIENAIGGRGKDKLIGNGVDNVLTGGKGKDVLLGGGGADTFVFTAKLGGKHADKIRDFGKGDDAIWISQASVKTLDKGMVSSADYAEHFDYSRGKLTYDGKLVAKLSGSPDLHADDLFIV